MLKTIIGYIRSKRSLIKENESLKHQIELMRDHINAQEIEKQQIAKRLRIAEQLHDIAQRNSLKRY